MLGAIDAHGNEIGPTHHGTLYEQFCDIESQWEKVKGELWAEVMQVMIWGHTRDLPSMSLVI